MLLRKLAVKYVFMKFLSLFIFLLAFNCSSVKTETKEPTQPEPEVVKKEAPKIEDEKLLVVLKNPDSIDNVKALVKNSGLTWDKMAFENNTTKIGVINVPGDKKDFWLERLKVSGDFKSVQENKKENLSALIKKAKAAFFTFRKSECLGDCPVYDVTIDEKGNVTYKGVKYVTVKGVQKFVLTEEEFTTLKEKLTKNSFSNYKKKYDNANIMDLPSTYISYKDTLVQIRLWKQIPKDLVDVHEYVQGILLDKKFFE